MVAWLLAQRVVAFMFRHACEGMFDMLGGMVGWRRRRRITLKLRACLAAASRLQWAKVGILGAWWPAEEEEESLLFKHVSTVLLTSSPASIRTLKSPTFAHFCPLCHSAGVMQA
jgi:hypothetical protein